MTRLPHILSQALLTLGLAACAHQVPVPASRSTEGWAEYDTPHFSIDTDLPPDQAQKAAQALERIRLTLTTAAWPGFAFPEVGRSQVIILADGLDFQRLFGRQVDALVNRNGIESRTVLWGKPDHWRARKTLAVDSSSSLLQHELVHDLAAFVYLRQPRWFSEGLAEFLATAELKDDGNVEVGQVDVFRLHDYAKHRTVTVKDALDWAGTNDSHAEGVTNGLYAVSWLMVHYLINTHPQEFATFQLALSQGTKPSVAWGQLAASLPSNLDGELEKYSKHGEYGVARRPFPFVADPPVSVRPLASADVHALRSTLATLAAGASSEARAEHREEARSELAEALAEDPTNVRAWAIAPHRAHSPEALAEAQKVSEAHPDDALAWYLLGRAAYEAKDLQQAEISLQKATELNGTMADAFNELAWVYVKAGRFQDALPLATKAAQLAPWNSAVLDTWAAALNGVGRCPEALAVEERAVDLLPERTRSTSAKSYGDALAVYQSSCGAAAQMSK